MMRNNKARQCQALLLVLFISIGRCNIVGPSETLEPKNRTSFGNLYSTITSDQVGALQFNTNLIL
jgi:hypothetical protein